MDIKWIFFDIGSTLVDEEAAYNHRIKDMIVGTDLSFEKVTAKRLEFFKQGLDGNSEIIKHYGLAKTPWHTEDEMLYSDTENVLKCLKNNGYRLGVIANQMPGLADRLAVWGIENYFDIIVSSAELGVAKSEPEIFETALSIAKCSPVQAVMVGDRLDNDIVPAKQCGMKTVWCRNGLALAAPKEFGNGYADFIIDSISELMNIF